MKRLTNLWSDLVSFENLWRAWRKARKGKSHKPVVAAFELELEHNLLALQQELISGEYCPGEYFLFTIYERKPRTIAAAPFRDRVVHHAVMNQIEAPLDRRFIFDSYACRKNKGVHAAVTRYQHWAKRYRYVLKIDVQQYFPSIDHDILKAKLRRRIKDRQVLDLLDLIIDGSPSVPSTAPLVYFPDDDLLTPLERRHGIPIGNLTSQFFANLYLDELDHWIKQTLRVSAYARYVDDAVLLSDDKSCLNDWREAISERLQQERLKLHPNKAHISQTRHGLNFLGYIVFPDFRLLRNDNGYRFRRRLRALADTYRQGYIELEDIDPGVQSWIGHACHADTLALRTQIFDEIYFSRGAGR